MSKKTEANPRAEQFKRNLRRLIKARGLTQKQAAMEIGVPYNWLRKACSDGVAREHPANEDQLQRVAAFFGITSLPLLWAEGLETDRTEPVTSSDHERLAYVAMLDKILQRIPKHRSVRKILKAIDNAVEHLPDTQSEDTENRQIGMLASDVEPEEMKTLDELPDYSDSNEPLKTRSLKTRSSKTKTAKTRTSKTKRVVEATENFDFSPTDQKLDDAAEFERELDKLLAETEENPDAFERRLQEDRDEKKRLDEFIASLPPSLVGRYRPNVLRNVVERALRDFDEDTLRKKLLELPPSELPE